MLAIGLFKLLSKNPLRLDQFRFVLMETTHPGNIGAAARAMKNMGIGELMLVKPHCYPDPVAWYRAAGAADLLDQAKVVASLDEAIAGCTLVLGTSTRERKLPWPTIFAHELGAWLVQDSAHLDARQSKVAILFGRESSGLNNTELQACHAHIVIDANTKYSSLNLAMAVQLIAYELRVGALRLAESRHAEVKVEVEAEIENAEIDAKVDAEVESAEVESAEVEAEVENAEVESAEVQGALALPNYWDAPPAQHQEVEFLLDHWDQVLQDLAFYEPGNPKQLLVRLRRLMQRLRLDRLEVGLLRGFLRAVQTRAKENASESKIR